MSRPSSQITAWALAAAGGVLAVAAVASVFLLSGSPAGATAPARSTGRAHRATVATASTVISAHSSELGTILVSPNGDTLYAFSRDRRNKDACAAISGCPKVWPLMAVHGKLTAGAGVKASLLGTITVGGVRQATYAGHPLYGYIDNDKPADTEYVGISQSGGTWAGGQPERGAHQIAIRPAGRRAQRAADRPKTPAVIICASGSMIASGSGNPSASPVSETCSTRS